MDAAPPTDAGFSTSLRMTELDERRNRQLRQIIHKLHVSPPRSAYLYEPALS
jgi:hypothetical protein